MQSHEVSAIPAGQVAAESQRWRRLGRFGMTFTYPPAILNNLFR